MAKIIVTLNGLIQQEVPLLKSRVAIGRRPDNDLVLDHPTISGKHAAIDTGTVGIFILDLGSTNGTQVNGQPVTRHLLQQDDVIEIGKYKLQYQVDKVRFAEPFTSAATSALTAKVKVSPIPVLAKIRVLNGSNAGKELVLNKEVTTLGRQGALVISITRQLEQYLIAHVEGNVFAKINDVTMNVIPRQLMDGDVIDLSGTKMLFSFLS